MSNLPHAVLGPWLEPDLGQDNNYWQPCENCEYYENGFPCANCHTTYLGKYEDCQECEKYTKEVNDGLCHCCIPCQNKMIREYYWQKNEDDEPDSNCSDFEEDSGMQVCDKCNSGMEDDFCPICGCSLRYVDFGSQDFYEECHPGTEKKDVG